MNRLGWCILWLALITLPFAPSVARGQEAVAASTTATATNGIATTTTTTVTAKKGQTLKVLAKILGVALEILARVNPQIRDASGVLLDGDRITVPPTRGPYAPYTPPFNPNPAPDDTTEVPAETNEVPVSEQPVTTDKPVTNQPVTNKPVTNKPVTNKPVTNKPVNKPVTNKPVQQTNTRDEVPPPIVPSEKINAVRAPVKATAEEREVMARIVKGETPANLSMEGQVAIAAVILNRVKANNPKEYGRGIIGVCQHPWQFSCYNPGKDYRDKLYNGPIPKRAYEAVDRALGGENPIGSATHYFNPYYAQPKWQHRLVKVCTIGQGRGQRHDFYRYKDK